MIGESPKNREQDAATPMCGMKVKMRSKRKIDIKATP
jgi:hypothetical protein